MSLVEPKLGAASFSCPHCSAHTSQSWYLARADRRQTGDLPRALDDQELARMMRPTSMIDPSDRKPIENLGELVLSYPFLISGRCDDGIHSQVANLHISECFSCNRLSIWKADQLLWPSVKRIHMPHSDMPANVRKDFEEADAVHQVSPRAAAALLRLAVQRLCIDLTGEENLNASIAVLVTRGMPIQVKKALDIVRVVGNHSVHPGQLASVDDAETAASLFDLVNLIVDHFITRPNAIDLMYENLPAGAKSAIERRDN